ncbi:diguanylate cyclase [Saccharospirillum mangrovi]|uniref:diguanylate cyclase n=1 Tax=Saccharospirillum mangrovi TaxID=2161747 RepID=UPI000D37A0B0|nr:diguanylate cyclase [Saccharospirillum mangrovi]
MTSPDNTQQRDELRQHFSRRVHDQARLVVNAWRTLDEVLWNPDWHQDFLRRCDKLLSLAVRYDLHPIRVEAEQLLALLASTRRDQAPPSHLLEALSEHIHRLAERCSRRDDSAAALNIDSRKPVYLCCSDDNQADSLRQHLHSFGIPAQIVADREALMLLVQHRRPAALLMDVEFDQAGLAIAQDIQHDQSPALPIYFYSQQTPSIEMRLAAARAEGAAFQEGTLDAGLLVKQLSALYAFRSEPPYRVLIVEDSPAQAFFAERTLNQAGMLTQVVDEPLTILDALESFQPDAILMDMYMPHCTGIELAQVIRQQWRYDVVPILYLSAEQDTRKQLEAMAQGGDDFLTKPVEPDMLVATVRNRCQRNRGLKEQMIRDSLTGLLDHINTLDVLRRSIQQAQAEQRDLCFAMIDIDHFKDVNDRFGHAVGDSVIRSLALFLRQRFRLTDRIGRYGGEEFAVVLHDIDLTKAGELLTKVSQSFAQIQHDAQSERINVTFSCGIAQLSPGDTANDLSKAADEALYQAKKSGRNRVCLAGQNS